MTARYELLELLGLGGMGAVYRGIHHPSGRSVAIKTLHSKYKRDARHRRLLLDEATAAAKIDDPRIVHLLDVGRETDGTPFLVMELARGVSFDRMIENWAGWASLAQGLTTVLEGLGVAHGQGIVHRDLKPSNIIVDPDSGRARILDFGVAKQIELLQAGERKHRVRGTPEFMPPEQLSGSGPFGPWTDLYAFGLTLCRVVRGRTPFHEARSPVQLLFQKESYAPSGSPEVRDGLTVPDGLQELIERLLRPQPRARPRFAAEVAAEFAELAAGVTDRINTLEGPRPVRGPDSTTQTIVDPSDVFEDSYLTPISESTSLVYEIPDLPAELPATPEDPGLGASLTRLREAPLVGRREERAEIRDLIAEVRRTGEPRLLLYLGEPGIGKSRLARWGLSHVEREGLMESTAGGYDPSGADVAAGLRHALRHLIGAPSRRPEVGWGWLDAEDLEHEDLAKYLLAEQEQATIAEDTAARMAHSVLRAMGRIRPLYLWLDDLAWARDGALPLVRALLDAGDVPVLIVATTRTGTAEHGASRERIAHLAGHPRTRVRELGALGPAERADLLDESAPLVPGLARELAERIDGSPLLLAQLVEDWLARGLLEADGPRYRTRGGASVNALLDERPLTALIEDRVEAMLGGFGVADAERILARAALLGARFERAALEAACASDQQLAASVDPVLDRALLIGLLRSAQSEVYSFDHGLIHEALVERIGQAADRTRALVDAADGLEARYGKERADIAGLVAGLLHRAGERERAWDRLRIAVVRAAWAGDDVRALHHLDTGREWLAEEPDQAWRLEHLLARVRYFQIRYEEALAALARARESALDDAARIHCDATEADVLFYLDRFAESEVITRRVLEHQPRQEDRDLWLLSAQAAHRLADLASMREDLETELHWREVSLSRARHSQDAFRVFVAIANVADVLALVGRTDEALELLHEERRNATERQDEISRVGVEQAIAQVEAIAGRGDGVRETLLRLREAVRASGDRWRLTQASAYCALLAARDCDDTTAARETREFLDAYRAVPHDESATVAAIGALAKELQASSLCNLAIEVSALLTARRERARRGFERRGPTS